MLVIWIRHHFLDFGAERRTPNAAHQNPRSMKIDRSKTYKSKYTWKYENSANMNQNRPKKRKKWKPKIMLACLHGPEWAQRGPRSVQRLELRPKLRLLARFHDLVIFDANYPIRCAMTHSSPLARSRKLKPTEIGHFRNFQVMSKLMTFSWK